MSKVQSQESEKALKNYQKKTLALLLITSCNKIQHKSEEEKKLDAFDQDLEKYM